MPKKENPHQIPEDLRHLRIITKKELSVLVPYVPQYIAKLEKSGLFPERVQLGANRVGWYLTDIEDWLNGRPRGTVSAPPGPNNENNGGAAAAVNHRRSRIAP